MYKKGTRKWFQMNNTITRIIGNSKFRKTIYINSRLYESIKNNYYIELNIVNEIKTLKVINKICDFVDNYNKIPRKESKDIHEKSLGHKLCNLKQSKNGKGNHVWNTSYQIEVEKRNYPKLFDIVNNTSNTINDINKICDFIDENDKIPNKRSTDELEKFLGIKLSSLKRNKHKNYRPFYDSYQLEANKRNYPNLFDINVK